MGITCSKKPEVEKTKKPTVKPQNQNVKIYIALYSYDRASNKDLSFTENELLEVLDQTEGDWWTARNSAGETGFIPKNFVALHKSIEAEPWYFKQITRQQADRKLMYRGNSVGAFLIRDSESQIGQYALSVRGADMTRHYRIRTRDKGGYFISEKYEFRTIQELVAHYSHNDSGLCCRLVKPCTRTEKPSAIGLSHNDKWEISRNEVMLGDKIGSGQFGDVYMGYYRKKTPVAVKTLKANSTNVKEFLQEAQIMKKMRHDKLVHLFAVCSKSEPIYIITELMKFGALVDYLQTDLGHLLDIKHLIDMCTQIATGMAFLETKNFIHRDLAARNILVAEDNIVKIADFGLARVIKEDEYSAKAGIKFPIKWTAPEALNFNRFSIKSDVWSFGILLTEIITYGRIPYPGMTNSEVVQKISQGYRMEQPENCPNSLYKIMMDCWIKEQHNRPTFHTLQWLLEDYFSSDSSEYGYGEVTNDT